MAEGHTMQWSKESEKRTNNDQENALPKTWDRATRILQLRNLHNFI